LLFFADHLVFSFRSD